MCGGMGLLQLTKSHLGLLNEMYSVALKVIAMQGKKPMDFSIGYHAETSIKHLILNVISNDFNASDLRTQSQWNSFNTQLFIPHDGELRVNFLPLKRQKIDSHFSNRYFIVELLHRIQKHGNVSKLDPILVQTLYDTPLKCHRCGAKPCNMHALKLHLRVHSN